MKIILVLSILAVSHVWAGSATADLIDPTPSKLGERLVVLSAKTQTTVSGTLQPMQGAIPGVEYVILNSRMEVVDYVMEASDLKLKAYVGKSVTASGTVFAKDSRYDTPVFICKSISDGTSTKTSSITEDKTPESKVLPIGGAVNVSVKVPKADSLVVSSQHYLVSDVGTLVKTTREIGGVDRVKYVLLNGETVLRYVVEPSDVDLAQFDGRTISLTGYMLGKNSRDDISVIQMRNASTFG